jgi:hypothetical protein
MICYSLPSVQFDLPSISVSPDYALAVVGMALIFTSFFRFAKWSLVDPV